CCQGK
ncbi:hypothetical protein BN1723_003624, partial [Verticillium longisporum]